MADKKYKDLWNGTLIQTIELILDIVILMVGFFLGIQLDSIIFDEEVISWLGILSINNIVIQMITYIVIAIIFFRVYRITVIRRKFNANIVSILLALFFTNVSLIIIAFISQVYDSAPLNNLLSSGLIFIIQAVLLMIVKFLFNKLIFNFNKRIAMIYGPKEEALKIAKAFILDDSNKTKLKYIIFDGDNPINEKMIEYLGEVNEVYISSELNEKHKDIIVNYVLQRTYCTLFFVPQTYEIGIQKSHLEKLDDILIFRTKSMHLTLEQRFFKRFFDIFFASFALILAVIPMLIVALMIKLEDRGPVFFKQQRIKRHDKYFNMIKFRSMRVDADQFTPATKNDSRITRVGKFIRATRLDEIPQLLNILKGEMSFVGPRPLLKNLIDATLKDHPEFAYRSNVKPGLTGLAQINGRYNTLDIEKLRYDLSYLRNYSLLLDLKIIFLTVGIVLNKDAARGVTVDSTFYDAAKERDVIFEEFDSGIEVDF